MPHQDIDLGTRLLSERRGLEWSEIMPAPSIGSWIVQQLVPFDFLLSRDLVVAGHMPYVATGAAIPIRRGSSGFRNLRRRDVFRAERVSDRRERAALSVKEFLINRGLRIIPALAVEIVLSALISGRSSRRRLGLLTSAGT